MQVLFTNKEIKRGIEVIAAEMNKYYQDEPVVIVPILNGGVFFYVDLVRQLAFPNTMGVISTSHYPNGKEVRDLEIKFYDMPHDITGRHVLLVDEICYTGKTLVELQNLLLDRGAKEVRTAVLINQPKEHENISHIPDWAALNYYGKEWIYGYGMDLNGLFRNRTDILK